MDEAGQANARQQQHHSRGSIIYEYTTQVITTFLTWSIVMYVPKAWLDTAMSEKLHRLPDYYSKRRQRVRECKGEQLFDCEVFIHIHAYISEAKYFGPSREYFA